MAAKVPQKATVGTTALGAASLRSTAAQRGVEKSVAVIAETTAEVAAQALNLAATTAMGMAAAKIRSRTHSVQATVRSASVVV